ncbi:hypothetical protein TMPK1_40380 [Rhodospirillales bacterium TMPK1]|uniref:Transcriptional regulator n=1 Tax=Roseiterribacter gracilis TaxID=2812848 RepID=A0A8S8XIC3_9PROT|nr:hypothetical protein TMPK1_40380 [Rhodospirillales bacterium TMPK1]
MPVNTPAQESALRSSRSNSLPPVSPDAHDGEAFPKAPSQLSPTHAAEARGLAPLLAETPRPTSKTLRPIRALLRGLDALRVLNMRNGATVTDVALATKLPRTTAHRVLETLCVGGYAVRDPSDERYRPTIAVKGLSDGFGDESWIREVAKPLIDQLTQKIIWPTAIATPMGTSLLVRGTTDKDSPLALERYSAGLRVPLLASASGIAYLAFCSADYRSALLDILARSTDAADAEAKNRTNVERQLDQVRQRGYVVHEWSPTRQASLAIPVLAGNQVVAVLSMRWITSALTEKQVVERYLPAMQDTARRISEAYLRHQTQSGAGEHALGPISHEGNGAG